MHVWNFKKICGVEFFQSWNFHFFNWSKIYSTEFFLIFPVSSSVFNKKDLYKKCGVTSLVIKLDAIDGKKWVRFVAMQQDSATLIYGLNKMKGTVESFLKKIAQPFKTVQFQAWKIAPSSRSLQKTENCLICFLIRDQFCAKLLHLSIIFNFIVLHWISVLK